MLEKAAPIKKFECLPLSSELKNQTSTAKKQCQELDKVHGLNKLVINKKREHSDLVYNNFDFNTFNTTGDEFNNLSDDSKHKHL